MLLLLAAVHLLAQAHVLYCAAARFLVFLRALSLRIHALYGLAADNC